MLYVYRDSSVTHEELFIYFLMNNAESDENYGTMGRVGTNWNFNSLFFPPAPLLGFRGDGINGRK